MEERTGVDEDALATLRATLREHEVAFALLFGSAARSETGWRDLDVAFEFETLRPADDGYSDAYLALLDALDRRLDVDVDLVDVHSAEPTFLRAAFDDGQLLVGSERRRSSLERALAGDRPKVDDARERVAAAVERLREGS